MKHLFLLSASALILTACTSSNWQGGGYVGHDNTPISSPSKTHGWDASIEGQSLNKIESLQSVISGVSTDIADSLELKLVRSTPLYIAPKERSDELTSLFDHGLRSKLVERGYTLSSIITPETYNLSYTLQPTDQKDAHPSAYDFIIWDMAGEEPLMLEKRTQELPPIPKN